jgi:hypothetical protein
VERTGYSKAAAIFAYVLVIAGLALAAICGGLVSALWLVTR